MTSAILTQIITTVIRNFTANSLDFIPKLNFDVTGYQIREIYSKNSIVGSIIDEDFGEYLIESALDYIDRELSNHIMVKEIAKECSASVRNLELIFRKHLNKTVKQYIRWKRR